ncbi:MAG: hypothetical protein QGI24_04800, partial [Kiritimatiellia bacterium]|nr:hypothetical protein [Kiritimatiellia bacterium]
MAVDPLALSNQRPKMSASVPVTTGQKIMLILLSLLIVAVAIRYPWPTAKAFVLFSTLFYLAFSFYKLLLLRLSVSSSSEINISEEQLAALIDYDMPVYSIMVPMYMEPESVP